MRSIASVFLISYGFVLCLGGLLLLELMWSRGLIHSDILSLFEELVSKTFFATLGFYSMDTRYLFFTIGTSRFF